MPEAIFNVRARSKQTNSNDLISRHIFVRLAILLRAEKKDSNAQFSGLLCENLILGEFIIARAPTKSQQNENNLTEIEAEGAK